MLFEDTQQWNRSCWKCKRNIKLHSLILFSKQGYATIEGKVLEIEVWGLGGAEIRENQAKLQERKNLFVEQKRKVLVSIGYWHTATKKRFLHIKT